MLHKTQGIVLRPVKYGDTSLVVTIFTEQFGIQAYMVKGVRVTGATRNRASYFQPGTLLDMVVYMQHGKNMQLIREYHAAYIYTSVHESVTKNSILMFSAELMLRLLPEHAPLPDLFTAASKYLISLDTADPRHVANYPLWFLALCSRLLGYDPRGSYGPATPYLDREYGGFSAHPPAYPPYTTTEDAFALHQVLLANDHDAIQGIAINSEMRSRLIDWYIAFLQQYTQHLGNIRSLPVLRSVLH
ncbi:hypothetical protein GCM10023093_07030 [Nemorincola caseinilytica]|uniref:DNA repair protein RecO n=1 Tax=Nemorincola caseinilytica TaxID=2054315 RepID=A0ABP8N5Q0_9BACT